MANNSYIRDKVLILFCLVYTSVTLLLQREHLLMYSSGSVKIERELGTGQFRIRIIKLVRVQWTAKIQRDVSNMTLCM